MKTFVEWLLHGDLSCLWLIETYFSFDAGQYNQLFDDELGKLSVSSPEYRDALERMRWFQLGRVILPRACETRACQGSTGNTGTNP